MPPSFMEGLKTAATSSYAFVAYICVVAAWTYVAIAQHRLRQVAKVIAHVPAEERAKLLEREYNVLPRSGLSAEQWITSRKHLLFFLAFLALLVAVLAISVVALTLRKEAIVKTSAKAVDWQMNLYLIDMQFSDQHGKTVAEKSCDDESRQKASISDPVKLPRDRVFEITAAVRLVVDNVFRTHQNMIYPIGLSTTWDHRVSTVFDGQDVQTYREGINATFERDFLAQATIQTPSTPGLQYVLIMSGATMTPRQIFTASVDENESAQSIWASPFSDFSGRVCSGYLKHGFSHPNGEIENAMWPIIAVPVSIQ